MRVNKHVVGKAKDFPNGERVVVNIGGREVVVFRQDGHFYALLNRCPHRGAPLCKGRFIANITSDAVGEYDFHGENRLLACPWHGWEFDIATGQSYFDPAGVRTRPFQVDLEPGSQVRDSVDCGEASFTPPDREPGATPDTPSDRKPGPYQAETYDVGVEDEYVVLRLRPNRRRRKPVPEHAELKGEG